MTTRSRGCRRGARRSRCRSQPRTPRLEVQRVVRPHLCGGTPTSGSRDAFGELTELRRGDIDCARTGLRFAAPSFVPTGSSSSASRSLTPASATSRSRRTCCPWSRATSRTSSAPALLFPAADDGDLHMAPSTLYKVYYPARDAAGRRDPALARPPPHRRRPRRPDRRDPRRVDGASRSLHARCSHAPPARRRRPRRRDCQAPVCARRSRRSADGPTLRP